MASNIPQDKSIVVNRLSSSLDTMRKFGVKRIGLFGSVVRGGAGKESDLDILVEFEEGDENFSNFMGLYFYLQDLLERKIDLVTRGGLSPHLAPFILKEVEYIETAS